MSIKKKNKFLSDLNKSNLLNTKVEKVNIFVNENYKTNFNKNKIKKIMDKCITSLNKSNRMGDRYSGNKEAKSMSIYKIIRKENKSTLIKKHSNYNKSVKNKVKIKNVFNRIKAYTPSKTTRFLVKNL